MYKAVIFDLDGTLLDTLRDLYESANKMLELSGYPLRTIDEIRQFVGNGMKKLVERCLPHKVEECESELLYNQFRKIYSENMENNTCPYEGIEECLKTLKSMGILSIVVSNKNHDAVNNLCDKYFGSLVSASYGVRDGVLPKPDKEMVRIALDEFSLKEDECIFVGDSETDILTSKNAGIRSVGVLWGFRSYDVLERSGADEIINKPSQIVDLIKKNS